ncbi:MAG: AMP-binding protein [Acidimicrobiales bacterium]
MTIDENLYRVLAHVDHQREFIITGDQTLTYGKVFEMAARFAASMVGLGVGPGDRVVVQVSKSVDALALYLGCLQLGAVQVPLNTAYTAAEVGYFVDDSEPSLVVLDPGSPQPTADHACAMVDLGELARLADQAQASEQVTSRGGRDLAMMLYTSGTTGRSKGAMLSHAALIANGRGLNQIWGFRPDDTLVHILPIFHVHGLFVALHSAMLSGARVEYFDRFDVDQTIDALARSTVMMGVPTHYTRLMASPRLDPDACSSMRLFTSGSAPMTAQVHEEFTARTRHQIVERYGMTECGIITSNPLDGNRVPGTVGFALPHTEIRVTRDGEVVEAGEAGIVEVRGPGLFDGYWRLPDKTAEEMRPGGWFVTGDVGHTSADGRLTLEGRAGDMIISGGYNIYPKEIELVLDEVPGIAESAVIGVPHPDFGEAVVAVVAGAWDEASVRPALDQHLARFKHPRHHIQLENLPRNAMGKVQKAALREQYRHLFSD